jgi:hypothetical protein
MPALSFSQKSPDATIVYAGDFSLQLAQRAAGTTILSSVACSVVQAVGDSEATLTLNGAAFLTGLSKVSQQVSSGSPGAVYTLEFKAPLSNGEILVATVNLPISTLVPQ